MDDRVPQRVADHARQGRVRGLTRQWRERARELDARARQLRLEGDTAGAADLEGAAADYRTDADSLEFGEEVTP